MPPAAIRDWVIDCDTHITEPPDVWTARLSVAAARPRAGDRARREVRLGRLEDRRADVDAHGRSHGGRGLARAVPVGAAHLRRGARRRARRARPARLHGFDRRLGDGALSERRRLRQRGVPPARRPGADAGLRRGVQRFPDRLDPGRPAPLHPDPRDAVLGSAGLGARDRAQCRARPPRRALHRRAAEVRLPDARRPALGSAVGRGARRGSPDQLPHRQRQPHRGIHAGAT